MWKYFSCELGKQIQSWLNQSCDIGVDSQELKGKKWKLGPLGRDKAIEKETGKRSWVLSYLSSAKDRYPFKEDSANS